MLVVRFIDGLAGSAFLSVAGMELSTRMLDAMLIRAILTGGTVGDVRNSPPSVKNTECRD